MNIVFRNRIASKTLNDQELHHDIYTHLQLRFRFLLVSSAHAIYNHVSSSTNPATTNIQSIADPARFLEAEKRVPHSISVHWCKLRLSDSTVRYYNTSGHPKVTTIGFYKPAGPPSALEKSAEVSPSEKKFMIRVHNLDPLRPSFVQW